jgi:hypothetical protein
LSSSAIGNIAETGKLFLRNVTCSLALRCDYSIRGFVIPSSLPDRDRRDSGSLSNYLIGFEGFGSFEDFLLDGGITGGVESEEFRRVFLGNNSSILR